jgi:hypothetical protein
VNSPPPRPEEPYKPIERTQILIWHSIGCFVVLVVAWSETVSRLLFESAGTGDPDLIVKAVLLLIMWPISASVIYRIVTRLYNVGKFLRICGWCSRVEVGGKWMKIEEHYKQETSSAVPHGLCPVCASVLFPTVGEELPKKK